MLLAAEALVLLVFFRICLVVVPVHTIILTITRGPAGIETDGDAGTGDGDAGADESEMRR